MSSWSEGYVSDVGYTHGYYHELNPARVKLALLSAGLVCPDIKHACELGFGQGLAINIHAAASSIEWHGTDFNPAQASFAQHLAQASGAAAKLYDQSFSEFASRTDLPDFDYIALHGIWSWISDANRALVVDFVRRKLKVGGVLYLSYNTLPGWASTAPMRHLMTQHAAAMSSPAAGIVSRINGSLEFTEKLFATNPTYLKANPSVQVRLKSLQGHSRQYLAHEYFNQDWEPMYFADVAKWLEGAKLTYACSAHYLDHVDPINLTEDQRALLGGLTDQTFRETVRDYMVNQQFRRDYWVKGSRKLPVPMRAANLRALPVVLTTNRADVPKVVNGALGECSLQEDVYNPILELLENHSVKTLGEIEQRIQGKKISFAQLVQSVTLLSGINQLTPAQDPSVTLTAQSHTDKLNAALLDLAAYSADITYLASPVTGGGIPVGRFDQLFLQSLKRGAKTPQTWARHAWVILSEQNYRLTKDGRTLESPQENVQELTRRATEFSVQQLPILKALQII